MGRLHTIYSVYIIHGSLIFANINTCLIFVKVKTFKELLWNGEFGILNLIKAKFLPMRRDNCL